MDGVLIQSRELIERAWVSVARSEGIAVSPAFIHEHIHGRPGEYTLQRLFADFDPAQRRRIKRRVDAIEEVGDCSLVPGVAKLIAQLRDGAVPLALVTSSWPARIEHVLRQHELEDTFDCVVSREDVDAGKPAPDCYRLAAQRLDRPPHECLVFEDSLSGVRSAVDSGALCLAIGGDPTLVTDGGAAAVYADFEALPVAQARTSTHAFDGGGLFIGAHASRRFA
ncbi:HAD family phosphatase [Pseudomonas sp. RIT-PI-AD]|uniref:HAD family hydrolase n=1 Tax=Pseudomonas sp. RIT-PI-AD TaxID=3035294 RepID=UPI0021D8428B|nr:HAD family phosphatase [Pseudomonas sp. RIT-PI-AD]